MTRLQVEETRPLLQQSERQITRTPLPWNQFWIILFLQLSDPLAMQTLSPFIPQLVRDIGVTHGDESQVGHYVGILQSSYYTAQALTVLHWSQLGFDVLLWTVEDFCRSGGEVRNQSQCLPVTDILTSRVICGAFNGSNGVVKSIVMDITDATNLPKAYDYMPLPWMIGNVFGPLVGGSLSRPADRFPEIFGRSELLKTYPYLLPCAVSAIFTSVAWLVTYFRFREDHTNCGHESVSISTPLWKFIKGWFLPQSYTKPSTHLESSYARLSDAWEANVEEVTSKPLPLRAVLTPKVLVMAANCSTMALLHIALTSILPVFYATPIELGGLSLDPPRIGAILAVSGLANGTSQLFFFSPLHDRFGAGVIHTVGVCAGIPIVILFPAINALARIHGMSLAVWLSVGVQLALMPSLVMCYSCMALYVSAAAPNRASFGTTNGIAQLLIAGGRIIGPALAASIFSYSMQEGHHAWLVYYFLMAIAFLAVGTSLLLPRNPSLWGDR
ncbi:MFS multidrug-resistance DHA1 sub-family [Suillus weaverae]|nr:MFS multidrug-resistance DHA1 sub-family [Suillus weaverae]